MGWVGRAGLGPVGAWVLRKSRSVGSRFSCPLELLALPQSQPMMVERWGEGQGECVLTGVYELASWFGVEEWPNE